jgi:hypothetical protein
VQYRIGGAGLMVNRNVAALAVLFLIVGVIVLMSIGGSPEKPAEQIKFPQLQSDFCSIMEGAGADYRKLLHQYSAATDAKNGIVQQQLSQQMTSIYQLRNKGVFEYLQRADFNFEDWIITVEKISSPNGGRVDLDFHPACSPATTVHARVSAESNHLNFLASLKQGDRIMVSGRFIERWGGKASSVPGKPVSAEEFEGSLTQSGSMNEPEYSAVITVLK